MSLSNIVGSPEFGRVGEAVTLAPRGEPVGELRYYLISAPAGSALLTLNNYEDRGKKRADARLKNAEGNKATFTPDVPGLYVPAVFDVTAVENIPHYQGETFSSGGDNEESGAPAYGVSGAIYYVAESRSRPVGLGADTATLRVWGFGNAVLPDRPAGIVRVELLSATGALAKVASQDEDVLAALEAVESSTDVQTHLDLSLADIALAIDYWNKHVGIPGGWNTHAAADATNVAAAAATDLTTALALLNDLKAKYNAHRVNLVAHGAADATNVVTAAAATDFATGLALWTDLRDRFSAHMTAPTPIHDPAATYPVDGAARAWIEPPRNSTVLVSKANSLRSLYEEHRVKVANVHPHAAVDTENVVRVDTTTLETLIASVNAWADAIDRHTSNRQADGSAASPAYHQSSGDPISDNARVPLRATDLLSAKRVAEYCLLAFEAHATNGGAAGRAHSAKAWGNLGITFANRYALRLTRAWHYATRGLQATTASGVNSGFAALITLGGWT